jgi:hypothetical protein
MKAQRETAPFAWCRRQLGKRLLLGKGAARQRHAKRQQKASDRKHAADEVLGSDDGGEAGADEAVATAGLAGRSVARDGARRSLFTAAV